MCCVVHAFRVRLQQFRAVLQAPLGLAGLVWAYTPRTLKIVAAGLALAATIVLVGALAAITLLALQLI